MESPSEVRHRHGQNQPAPAPESSAGADQLPEDLHPAGRVRHGGFKQAIRILLFTTYICTCCICINITQFLGSPLYFINKDYYYTFMSFTKQSFGIFATLMTQWWSPTLIRISGDSSVRGQLRKTKDGRLECDFPERLIMIANHQIYSDWLYLWWIAYTNRMHGHIFIILKESLKYIPVLGPGMMFYGFIFLARNWTKDKPRFAHRLQKLKSQHTGPMSGQNCLDPMWLLIYPEGTNLSNNGRRTSAKWAEKQGLQDLRHALLPRTTGLQFCLQELKGTVEWVYDCTVAYEGVPRGKYGQDYFTLYSTYFQGRPPKSVNMHWRRFKVADIPIDDPQAFELWIRQRWIEKDDMLEQYMQTGRFPADNGTESYIDHERIVEKEIGDRKVAQGAGFIETEVRLVHWWEFGQIFATLGGFALAANLGAKCWNLVFYGNFRGAG